MGDAATRLRGPIDALVGGRDVILTAPVVRGTGPIVGAVRAHGAERVLVLATSEGTGERPDDVTGVVVDAEVATMTEELLALEAITERLTPAHHAALDAWDPERRALVLANPFTVGDDLGGRRIVGARRPAWAAVEDKVTVDALLVAADVPAPAHEVVGPDEAGAAARRLDGGDGVVVAAGGRNGGAEGVRWVSAAEAIAAAHEVAGAFTGARGDGVGRVRVASFVEGIPCSIGAVITADGVATVRPVENVVLRRGRELRYSGLSSLFDPPPSVREAMEAAARRVGEELRRRVGYRGAFSIDGIVGADGWVATEVNARLSGGFSTLPVPLRTDLPHIALVQIALVEGLADEVLTATAIEEAYGAAAESTRTLRLARVLPEVPAGGPAEAAVVVEGHTARRAADGEAAHGALLVGDAASGGVVLARLTTAEAPLPVGPAAAPLATSLLDLADDLWGTGTRGLVPPGSERPLGEP
jgi:hypothetical protein